MEKLTLGKNTIQPGGVSPNSLICPGGSPNSLICLGFANGGGVLGGFLDGHFASSEPFFWWGLAASSWKLLKGNSWKAPTKRRTGGLACVEDPFLPKGKIGNELRHV